MVLRRHYVRCVDLCLYHVNWNLTAEEMAR